MMTNHSIVSLVVSLYLSSILACGNILPPPSYVYVSVEIENGIDADRSVLLTYSIRNNGDSRISEIEIYSDLIDDLEKIYAIAHIDAVQIEPGKVGRVTVDISGHFFYIAKTLTIKTFYIKKIVFEDGSTWEDVDGYYSYPYSE